MKNNRLKMHKQGTKGSLLELVVGPWHTLWIDLYREISSAGQLKGCFCTQTQQHQYQHIQSPAENSFTM